METKRYLLECLTNLHVGSGEENVGVVDNRVQRDATTGFPVIHGSGIKGALRAHFEEIEGLQPDQMEQLFGSDMGAKVLKQGDLVFTDAQLVSLPVRASVKPFFRTISPSLLRHLAHWFAGFGSSEYSNALLDAANNCGTESFSTHAQKAYAEDEELASRPAFLLPDSINKLLGDDLAVLQDAAFQYRCEHLPIVARNQLENGISKNLWYEELVPHYTRFTMAIVDKGQTQFNLDGKRVQIGANASIGYGWIQFTLLP